MMNARKEFTFSTGPPPWAMDMSAMGTCSASSRPVSSLAFITTRPGTMFGHMHFELPLLSRPVMVPWEKGPSCSRRACRLPKAPPRGVVRLPFAGVRRHVVDVCRDDSTGFARGASIGRVIRHVDPRDAVAVVQGARVVVAPVTVLRLPGLRKLVRVCLPAVSRPSARRRRFPISLLSVPSLRGRQGPRAPPVMARTAPLVRPISSAWLPSRRRSTTRR